MEPIGAGAVVSVLGEALLDLAKAVKTAVVPLAFGLVCAASAGGLYVWLLADEPLADFFGAASQVGVGLLLALIVERVIAQTDNWVERQIRAGTVALTALGTACALAGVASDSSILNGVLFALAWGGIAAGTLGLFALISARTSVALAGGGRVADRHNASRDRHAAQTAHEPDGEEED